jgi:hypothetical protein
LDSLGELVSGETGPEDGDVALGERFLGEALDVGSGDGRVRRGEERVAETASEGSRVGEVEGEGGRGREGREGLGLDGGENQLGVLVGVKVGRGEDGRENVEEVGPVGSARIRLFVDGETHSSPRRNSAVRNRCSRERAAERTPPYSSASRAVFRADPASVDWVC